MDNGRDHVAINFTAWSIPRPISFLLVTLIWCFLLINVACEPGGKSSRKNVGSAAVERTDIPEKSNVEKPVQRERTIELETDVSDDGIELFVSQWEDETAGEKFPFPESPEIIELLTRAKTLESKMRLTRPGGDNALALYRKVLEIEPESETALSGIISIRDFFLEKGDVAISAKKYTEAAWNYRKALDVSPGDTLVISKLDNLNRELDQRAKAETDKTLILDRDKEIYALLSRAEELEKNPDQSLISNASEYYRRALQLDPDNKRGWAGINRIKKWYLKKAEEAQLSDKYHLSIANYKKALELAPGDEQIELKIGEITEKLAHIEIESREKPRQTIKDIKVTSTQPITNKELPAASKKLQIEFAEIPAGEFTMGSVDGEKDESPPHKVKLSSFNIGKYEITQDQWISVMNYNPSEYSNCSGCPVENVTWSEVGEFLEKAGEMINRKLRLPTEAEWEYAARGGAQGTIWAGTDNERFLKEYAWFSLNSVGRPHLAGIKKPNGYGLYDMSGNVWEWCSDWYNDRYYSNSPQETPTGPQDGSYHVVRGGAWFNFPGMIRITNRAKHSPGKQNNSNGFRVVSD